MTTTVFEFECSPRVGCGYKFFWECGDPFEEDPSCPKCGEEVCVFPTTANPFQAEVNYHSRHCKAVCGLCDMDTSADCPACKSNLVGFAPAVF